MGNYHMSIRNETPDYYSYCFRYHPEWEGIVVSFTKTCPCNIQRIFFFRSKKCKFHWKKFDNFNIFAQNIDCGFTLEPPHVVLAK